MYPAPRVSVQRILVVANGLHAFDLGPSFLDRARCRVRMAATGAEALRMLAAWHPHVLIYHPQLPDMTGAELARLARATGAEVKLFLLTDSVTPPSGLASGPDPDAHLVEPFDQAQLLGTLAALIEVPVRRAPRVRVNLLARLTLPGHGDFAADVNILSLSERGALIEAPSSLAAGAIGRLQFSLRARRLAVPCTVGAVMDEVQLHHGVEFIGIDDETRGHIAAFVTAKHDGVAGEDDDADDWD
jgi:CheY-like chemotaxis protein